MDRDLCAPYLRQQPQARVRRCSQNQKLQRNLAECRQSLAALRQALRKKNKELYVAKRSLMGRQCPASLETLAAGIAHDLRNPLNFVNSFAAISVEHFRELRAILAGQKQRLDPGIFDNMDNLVADLEENAQVIDENGKRANKIVEQMVSLAHGRAESLQQTDINLLVSTYVQLAYKGFRIKHPQMECRLEESYEDGLPEARALPHSLGRVLINLMNNGFEAMLEKGGLGKEGFKPCLKIRTRTCGNRVLIGIRDNGMGISQEKLAQIFEPFFSTKGGHGENLGMGLAICKDIVEREHGGELRVASEEGSFTELLIYLPPVLPGSGGAAFASGSGGPGFPAKLP